jgi:hypothetical protein
LGYLGTAAYTTEGGSSLALVIIESQEPTQAGEYRHRHLQTLELSVPLSDAWTYVAQSDYGFQNDAQINGKDARWYGLNQYLFYQTSDTWTWGVRAEWFRDDGGYRVQSFSTPGWSGAPGFNGSFYEITFGGNWKPNANFVARPSIRWDWYSGSPNNDGQLPFDDGTDSNQVLIGGDIILLY